MKFVKVADTSDLAPGKAIMATVGDEEIGIFLIDGNYYAVEDKCPHREGPLHEGLVEGLTVTCPWHFAKFDLKTGKVVEQPASAGIKTYEVRVEGEAIEVGIPQRPE